MRTKAAQVLGYFATKRARERSARRAVQVLVVAVEVVPASEQLVAHWAREHGAARVAAIATTAGITCKQQTS